ncbi:lactate/malate family dehydrogenase, partial [Enterobacter asburiae]
SKTAWPPTPQLPSGSELSLYDIAPVTPGVAVDLSHIPTAVKIKGFSGEDATPALEGADVVLISAGVARKPGKDRSHKSDHSNVVLRDKELSG